MFGRRRRPRPLVVDVDPDASLAHGTVVDTRIVARLARVPLLRLEGTVVLTPGRAHVTPPEDLPIAALPVLEGEVVRPSPSPTAPAPVNGSPQIGTDLPELAERLARLRRR